MKRFTDKQRIDHLARCTSYRWKVICDDSFAKLADKAAYTRNGWRKSTRAAIDAAMRASLSKVKL